MIRAVLFDLYDTLLYLDSPVVAETQTAGWTRAVVLYPETIPTLAALRERGLRLGLISNCSAQAGAVLDRIGLSERFDAVVLSCAVGLAKPDRAIFEHACRALGVALQESLFVAD